MKLSNYLIHICMLQEEGMLECIDAEVSCV